MQKQKTSKEYIGYYKATSNVHCRLGAGKDKYESIGVIPSGTKCYCSGGYNYSADKTLWLVVKAGDLTGYVSTKCLTSIKICDVVSAAKALSAKMLKAGDWKYINGLTEAKKYGKNQCYNIDDFSKKAYHGINCSGFVSLALQSKGWVSKGSNMYSYTTETACKNHTKKGKGSFWTDIKKHATVINYNGVLASTVKLQHGDICMWNNHTNIYISKNKWYDAGSSMTNTGEHGGTFKSFTKTQDRSNKKLYTIIRFH